MHANTSYYTSIPQTTVAELLLDYLRLEGVHVIFGVPGGAVSNLLLALKEQEDRPDAIKYIICRQETGAAFMADGFSRVTGLPGIVLVTSGPGATNALTGTMNAQNSGAAVLTITGEIPEAFFGMGYLQEGIDATLDIVDVYRNASGYSVMVDGPSNFQTLFTQALRQALSRPHCASHISLPDDVAGAQIQNVQFPNSPINYRALPQSSAPQLVQIAFEHLTGAARPLILLGNGCREAFARKDREGEPTRLEKFIAFVEKFGIPVMTTPNAKGVFPESHPLSLRSYGMAGSMWTHRYMGDPASPEHYDELMVMGSTLGQLATNKWDKILIPHGPFIQVDLMAGVIARAFPVELGIVAEIGHVVDDFYAISKRTTADDAAVAARKAFIARIKQDFSPYYEPEKRASNAEPILPQAMMRVINEKLPAGSHIFIDGGNCIGWSLHYLEIDPPTQIHNSLTMGAMGFGVGAAAGAKLGLPDATCICITGDGAFLMQGSEISTAAQNHIGAIWIVLFDNDLGMVSQGQAVRFQKQIDPAVWKHYYKQGHPDLVQYSQALGADAYAVHNTEEMAEALDHAITRANRDHRPQVIVAHIDTNEMPSYYIQYPTESQIG